MCSQARRLRKGKTKGDPWTSGVLSPYSKVFSVCAKFVLVHSRFELTLVAPGIETPQSKHRDSKSRRAGNINLGHMCQTLRFGGG